MKRPTIVTTLMLLGALGAFGRFLPVKDVKTLVAESELVFVGRVKSAKPSGITTSLSYPTWQGVVFEWLRVDVEVLESIKGTKSGEVVQIAMLAVDERKGPRPMMNPPGMLEPKKGDEFLLFLVPTARTNLFAALTAPYDDDQSIFRLDRSLPNYRSYREGKEKQDSPFYERHRVIWSLVDDARQIVPSGAALMRKTYAREIGMESSNRVVHLQWQKYTNPSGWSHDIPKETGNETNSDHK